MPCVFHVTCRVLVAAVVELKLVLRLQHRGVMPVRPRRRNRRRKLRLVQLEGGVLQFADEEPVHEQLAARAERDRFLGKKTRGSSPREQNQQCTGGLHIR